MTAGTQGDWTTGILVALDLEGSGAQDHDDEAILEIAVVPITAGQPDISASYSTLINPGRPIPRRPWISPGLTTAVLAAAPARPTSSRNWPAESTGIPRRPQRRRRLAAAAPPLPGHRPRSADRHPAPGPPPQPGQQEQP